MIQLDLLDRVKSLQYILKVLLQLIFVQIRGSMVEEYLLIFPGPSGGESSSNFRGLVKKDDLNLGNNQG